MNMKEKLTIFLFVFNTSVKAGNVNVGYLASEVGSSLGYQAIYNIYLKNKERYNN